MTIPRMTIALLLGMFLISGSAVAQTGVVKRVKCADAISSVNKNDLGVFHSNSSGVDKTITFQVIRDGCRPKSPDGDFRVYVRETSLTTSVLIDRKGKYSESETRPFPSGSWSYIVFVPGPGLMAKSTFDYTYTIHD